MSGDKVFSFGFGAKSKVLPIRALEVRMMEFYRFVAMIVSVIQNDRNSSTNIGIAINKKAL